MRPALALVTVLGLTLLGCIREAALPGRPCPCAAGFVCCARLQVCHAPEELGRLACAVDAGPARDAETPDETPDEKADDGSDAPADAPADAPGGDADAPADAPGGDAAVPADTPEPDRPAIDASPGDPVAGDRGSSAEPAPVACGSGQVQVTYFANQDLAGAPVLTRGERGVSFVWGEDSPAPGVGADGWSALVGGELTPELTDDYTLFVDSDDGFRLWLGGELLLDWWRGAPGYTLATTVRLARDRRYPLLIEYYDTVALAHLKLTWQRPGTDRGPVGTCALEAQAPQRSSCPAAVGHACPRALPFPCGDGDGLRLGYHPGGPFGAPTRTEEGAGLTFDWGWLPEPASRVEAWGARWEGTLEAPVTATYVFYLLADGHTELTVADQKAIVLDEETPVRGESTLTVALEAGGRYPVRMTYATRHAPAWSFVQVRWKVGEAPKGPVPTCFFSGPRAPDGGAPQ